MLFALQSLAYGQGFKSRYFVPQSSGNSTKALFEISPGSYIGAGFAVDTSTNYPYNSIVITGLGPQGQVQWTKKYKGNKIEYLNNGFIQRCFYKQGGFLYYAGGAVDTVGAQIGVFIKFDMNGDTLWQKIYHDSTSIDLIPQMVTGSVDGGFLITGFFQNWIVHNQQGLILKTDASGHELWRKKINKVSPNVEDGKAILQDSASKKIAIVGFQYIGNNSNYDNLLILDSLGTKLKQTNICYYGGNGSDLIQTRDKKLIMVGWQYYAQTVGTYNCMRSFAAKFDINDPVGTPPIWEINGFDKLAVNNGFCCAIELANEDVLFCGAIDTLQGVWNGPNNTPGNSLTRLTRVDKNGNIKWSKYYNYKTNDSTEENVQGIRSINLCQDGSWLAAIEGLNYGINPLFFVKYDSTGCDSSVAYCAMMSIVGMKEFSIKGYDFKLYPNPVQDRLNLETNYPEETELVISDISGREILRTKIQKSAQIDLSDLKQGLYLAQLFREERLLGTEKILKQ